MNSMLAHVMVDEETQREIERVTYTKKQGYKYIRIFYIGRYPAEVKKLQGLKTVNCIRQQQDDGTIKYIADDSGNKSEPIYFHVSPTGEKYADIWDDPDGWNRHYLKSHLEMKDSDIDVEDNDIKDEILSLDEKAFRAELSEEEMIDKEIEALKRRKMSFKSDNDKKKSRKSYRSGMKGESEKDQTDGYDKPKFNVD